MKLAGFNHSKRPWLAPLALGIVAVLLGLAHLAQVRESPFFYHPIVDAFDYDNDAWYIAQSGDWAGGGTVFFQAPLFVYFLALVYKVFGHDLLLPRLIQVILGGFTVAGVFLIARRIFGERAAWIAGIGAAVYSLLIFYQAELLAPTITVFLDVAFLLVFFALAWPRSGWAWAAPGLVFGLRALATTNNLAAAPVFWIWAALRGRGQGWGVKRTVLTIAAFTLGAAAAIAPVTVRNWVVGRQLVLVSSNAGLNFYLGNSGDYGAKVGLRPGAEWEELMNRPLRAGARTESAMSAYYLGETWKYIRSHPGQYGRLLLHKARLFVRGDEILRNQEIYPFREHSTVLRLLLWKVGWPGGPGLAFPFGVLLPAAWPGLLLVLRRRNLEGGLLAAFAVAYSLSVVAFFVTARYRVPVVIPLLILTGYGLAQFRDLWRSPRLRAITLAGMIALALVSNWNPGPMSREMNADAYFSLAGTYAARGDRAGAEHYYGKTLDINPGDAAAWLNLGLEVYEAESRMGEAEVCYRRALALRPDYALAVFNLGHLAEVRGLPSEAESLYWEAARLDSLMSGPYQNLAAMALARGDYPRARDIYREAHERNPYSAAILAGLATATFKTDGLDSALVLFGEAIRLAPRDPDIYYNLALVYLREGRASAAAEAALKLMEVDPEDNQAYVIFAEAMRSAGRVREARQVIGEAVRRRSDLPGPRQALERLSAGGVEAGGGAQDPGSR
jgi:tetratricopeptide (TPR) repeat protein/4-amino-4-deoxy-L-arabinose transferase-like glycosyltransferase